MAAAEEKRKATEEAERKEKEQIASAKLVQAERKHALAAEARHKAFLIKLANKIDKQHKHDIK